MAVTGLPAGPARGVPPAPPRDRARPLLRASAPPRPCSPPGIVMRPPVMPISFRASRRKCSWRTGRADADLRPRRRVRTCRTTPSHGPRDRASGSRRLRLPITPRGEAHPLACFAPKPLRITPTRRRCRGSPTIRAAGRTGSPSAASRRWRATASGRPRARTTWPSSRWVRDPGPARSDGRDRAARGVRPRAPARVRTARAACDCGRRGRVWADSAPGSGQIVSWTSPIRLFPATASVLRPGTNLWPGCLAHRAMRECAHGKRYE